jgi:hypothetical protein
VNGAEQGDCGWRRRSRPNAAALSKIGSLRDALSLSDGTVGGLGTVVQSFVRSKLNAGHDRLLCGRVGASLMVIMRFGKQPCFRRSRMGLPQSLCSIGTRSGNIRARGSSLLARPYIARLSVFNRLICPSFCPLLQRSDNTFPAASILRRKVRANHCMACIQERCAS